MPTLKLIDRFHKAVETGDAAAVANFLVDLPSLVRLEGTTRTPALRVAASNADVPMMKVLLAGGADINQFSGSTTASPIPGTALTAACSAAVNDKRPATRKDAILFLLDNGADWRLTYDGVLQSTAAHKLLYAGLTNRGRSWDDVLSTVLKPMFEAGLHPDTAADGGMGLLHVAARVPWSSTALIDYLLENGATIGLKARDGRTPLHHAASLVSEVVMMGLIDHGADINAQNSAGQTPLFFLDHQHSCDVLLDRGADLEHQDINGRTALMSVVAGLMTDSPSRLILSLLEAGSSVTLRDEAGDTVADIASRKGFQAVLSAINARKAREAVSSVIMKAGVQPR